MNNRSPRLWSHTGIHVVRSERRQPQHLASMEALPQPIYLQTWFENDLDLEEELSGHGLNRWTVLGLTLVVVTSGAFWTGVGLLVSHWLK